MRDGGGEKPNHEINLLTAFMFNECRVDLFSICPQIFQGSEQIVNCISGWMLTDQVRQGRVKTVRTPIQDSGLVVCKNHL